MDENIDYLQKLESDLIEQFRGKNNIRVFQKAVARQFKELYAFFYELYTLQWLDKTQGIQLDGIGNIVQLSRTEALIWSNLAGITTPMDDDLYRLYLLFKIFLNTSTGTYADIVRTLKMFWSHTPIYYSEDINIPATMFFTTEPLSSWETDLRVLQIVTRVKAAGVSLHFIVPAPTYEDIVEYYVAIKSIFIKQYIVCDTLDISDDSIIIYNATGATIFKREYIIADNISLSGEVASNSTVGIDQIIKEVH